MRVFPFLERFPLRGPKSRDLAIFRQISQRVLSREHLNPGGVLRIVDRRSAMNHGGKRRRSESEIRATLSTGNPQRPYAGLPGEAGMKIWSTPHGDMGVT
jgi:hypothetical protein